MLGVAEMLKFVGKDEEYGSQNQYNNWKVAEKHCRIGSRWFQFSCNLHWISLNNETYPVLIQIPQWRCYVMPSWRHHTLQRTMSKKSKNIDRTFGSSKTLVVWFVGDQPGDSCDEDRLGHQFLYGNPCPPWHEGWDAEANVHRVQTQKNPDATTSGFIYGCRLPGFSERCFTFHNIFLID